MLDAGLVMGNRGVLHDDRRRIVRYSNVKRWIACRIEFRGRRRSIMQPKRYTELFFLDEATAFSAGHRPCRECRYADYQRFRGLWESCHGGPARADAMDVQLHRERLIDGSKRTYRSDVDALPDGTYVALDGEAWLVWGGELLAWSSAGYGNRKSRPVRTEVDVLTPRSMSPFSPRAIAPGSTQRMVKETRRLTPSEV